MFKFINSIVRKCFQLVDKKSTRIAFFINLGFTVTFEHVLNLVLVSFWLILNVYLLTEVVPRIATF